jgi:virulence-associated protein VagC
MNWFVEALRDRMAELHEYQSWELNVSTAEIIDIGGTQAIKLPPDIRFVDKQVSVRQAGDSVVVEPIKATVWPKDFFEKVHIEDPKFERPPQGELPPAPHLD